MQESDTNYGWSTADEQDDHSYTLPAIRRLLPPGRLRILDAGCGNGFIAAALAREGHDVVGVDASEDGIRIARAAHPGVEFHVRSVYDDLSDVASGMDVVVSSEVIEHLYSPQRFLVNVGLTLRSGGSIVLTTPYHGYLKNLALSLANAWDKHHTVAWEGGHIKFFSEKTLTAMLREAGYEQVVFSNAGRMLWLWKSMVCRAVRSS